MNAKAHKLIDDIVNRHGGIIVDKRNNQRWDPGQAVCAQAYGPNWYKTDDFLKDDREDELTERWYEAAEVLATSTPDWIQK